MPPSSTKKCRSRFAWPAAAGLVAAAAGAALALLASPTTVAAENAAAGRAQPGVVEIVQDGFRYAYHAPTATAALFDVTSAATERVNVIDQHEKLAGEMRRSLERKLHVRSLDDLSAPYADAIRRLHELGYL